jgi:alkylation response protein AidB-like acyl-CoA dehydrogenase
MGVQAAEPSLSNPTLDAAFRFFREEVAPRAQEIDGDPRALAVAVRGLCERDLMALRRPMRFGGPDLDDLAFFAYQQEIARTSGALAFLTTQHQSAVGMISRSENIALVGEYLPQMGDGRRLVGIGFSQLRRAGPPICRAQRVDGGYVLDGEVPWVTGATYFQEFLVGAALPDGQAVFGLAPLSDQMDGSVTLSAPMRLAAMESANTVIVALSSFFLANERTLFLRPAGWIAQNDKINVTMQAHFALGCARAGIDIVSLTGERRNLPILKDVAADLLSEWNRCNQAGADIIERADETSTTEGLRNRAWSIDLAVRCAHAAVAASSGAANLRTNPAQRVYREALVYTVSAQTLQIMEATLARLVR